MDDSSSWQLSQSFVSDGQGVRSACVLLSTDDDSDDDWYKIVCGSQGGTLCEFAVPSGTMQLIDYQHNHAITALCSFVIDDGQKQHYYYATGCKDAGIRIMDATSHSVVATLEGHEKAVTSLAFLEPHFLISGSWDGTAKVWNVSNHSLVTTLEGHENTVSVCGLNSDTTTDDKNFMLTIATGSAGIAQNNTISDHSIRIWQVQTTTGQSKLLHHVSNDHDGPIRDVTLVGQQDGTTTSKLASCSNDGTVRLRSAETGATTATLMFVPPQQQQHPPMLLSVTSLNNNGNMVAASAEDGHVIVWDNDAGNNPSILKHASCVWNVLALPNGDVATCCQDGNLRIFTLEKARMAPQNVRDEFIKQVQEAQQKQSSGPSPEEIANLPKWEMNSLIKGRSEGQVQLFNKDNGTAIAAQWSMASQTWIEVGQVMGTAEETSGMIDGVKYDHVLPIEVDVPAAADGGGGGGVAKLQIGYNNGENPFVAAQRFIDAHVLPQYHLADIADYIQKRVGHAAPTLGMDSSSTGAASAAGTPMAIYEHLPVRGYKCFELSDKTKAATLEKMKLKIQEFDSTTNKLNSEKLTELFDTLAATNRYHASKISNEELSLIQIMLDEWPPAQAFPALDLARLVVLHPDASGRNRTDYWNKVLQLALKQCQQVTDSDGTAAVAIPMLSLRLFANCFRGGPGSVDAATGQLDSILTCAESLVLSKNKNIRLSVATVLLNISSLLHSMGTSTADVAGFACRVVSIVNAVLESKLYESEATVRALIALGTVVLASSEAKEAAQSLYLTTKVEPAASPYGDKAKAVAKEIYSILA